MSTQDKKPERIYKGLGGRRREYDEQGREISRQSRIRWSADADKNAELAAAKDSPYYWWWKFLRESSDYQEELRRRSGGAYAQIVSDFGRLGDNFDHWWLRRGREIFAEKVALPRVRVLDHGTIVNSRHINPNVVVEIPLTIRRATLLKQINKILSEIHPGTNLRVHKHGSADRKLYAKSRMRLTTLALLDKVWQERKENPDDDWYLTGEKLRLSPVFIADARDSAQTIAYKRRCMTIVVQRYYRKAQALINFAAKGDFPRIK